jgi:hypothetical protein
MKGCHENAALRGQQPHLWNNRAIQMDSQTDLMFTEKK